LILDSIYLLPLARIAIDTDLLRMILEGKIDIKLRNVSINLISVLELQAKAAKLKVPATTVIKAIKFIIKAFNIVFFHEPEIVKISHEIRKYIPDYIDCVIVATAINLKEDLVTEDTIIHEVKEVIEKRYGVRIFRYYDLVKARSLS